MKLRSIIIAAVLTVFASASLADEVILITNNGNSETTLTQRDAMNAFLGKKSSWNNGNDITAYMQGNSDVSVAFTQKFVKRSASQFNLHWRKAIFSRKGTPPQNKSDSAAIKTAVAGKIGSID
jgi:hypothetical protein